MARDQATRLSREHRPVEVLEKIARHQTMVLSERDRAVFFDTLVHPPEPSPRLRRAFAAARLRIES
jgi:uncharacterized protein (DUF1778 family)